MRPDSSPLLEQVGDFPTGSELVADAIRVDVLELRGLLDGKYYIMWMNNPPDMPG